MIDCQYIRSFKIRMTITVSSFITKKLNRCGKAYSILPTLESIDLSLYTPWKMDSISGELPS